MNAVAAGSIHLESANLGVDDLRELMRAVTETTERLQGTHEILSAEVARLQAELAEANKRLRRSQSLAALGEMAAGIAHEVRNPLGSIRLYLQMLSEDLVDRPDQQAICAKLDRAVTGLDAIVRDVLAFARETRVSPAPTTTGQIVDRALAACEALRREGGVAIATRPADDLSIEADGTLLVQALGNVIRNAIEAMVEAESPHRALHVDVSRRAERCPDGRRDERVIFAVEDTGPGVSADVVERMFNPFFTTRRTGTGLGLAIVHRIVDAHGGHVNVGAGRDGGARVELCIEARAPRTGANGSRPAPLVEVSRLSPAGAAASREITENS